MGLPLATDMRLPPELLSLVCRQLAAARQRGTLAAVLRSGWAGYAAAAPHLYARLSLSRESFPGLVAGLPFGRRGQEGWALIPLGADVVPLTESAEGAERAELGDCEPVWPNAASAQRKRALLAHCTALSVEGYPDLGLFGAVCVLAWPGLPETQRAKAPSGLFPRVNDVALHPLPWAVLPGADGMPLAALGLAHPLLGLLAALRPARVAVHFAHAGVDDSDWPELDVLRAACRAWRPEEFVLVE